MRLWGLLFFFLVGFVRPLAAAESNYFAAEPCVVAKDCWERIPVVTDGYATVYRSFPLTERHPEVDTAVIVVHGVLRNADEYFNGVVAAARIEGALSRTMIVAPHFKGPDDKLAPGDLSWPAGWKHGRLAINRESTVSTFTVADRIVTLLANSGNFPRLRRIVITGHSAGGQFLSRYSLATSVDETIGAVALRFIIANPSSYVYLTEDRELAPEGCPDFDDYPYGLKTPYGYLATVPQATLWRHARDRDLTIFVGEADTGTDYLDMTCPAMAQGANRYARGLAYYRHLQKAVAGTRVRLVTAPSVGHSGDEMFASPAGRRLLFEN